MIIVTILESGTFSLDPSCLLFSLVYGAMPGTQKTINTFPKKVQAVTPERERGAALAIDLQLSAPKMSQVSYS